MEPVLEANRLEAAKDFRLDLRFTFQQDNDSKQTASTAVGCVKSRYIYVVEWPSQRIDLNLIKTEAHLEN